MKALLAPVFTVLVALFSLQAHALYTPQDAIADALADNLVYVGKFIPTYSEGGRIPVCVYRGDKTVVYVSYCTDEVIPAFGVRIHSKDKGFVSIYAETEDGKDIEKVKRGEYYDVLWRISARENRSTFAFDGDIKKMRNFDEGLAKNALSDCIVSYSFPLLCQDSHLSEEGPWGGPAQVFRKSPNADWYKFIRFMNEKTP